MRRVRQYRRDSNVENVLGEDESCVVKEEQSVGENFNDADCNESTADAGVPSAIQIESGNQVFVKVEESSMLLEDETCDGEDFNDADCSETGEDNAVPSSLQTEMGKQIVVKVEPSVGEYFDIADCSETEADGEVTSATQVESGNERSKARESMKRKRERQVEEETTCRRMRTRGGPFTAKENTDTTPEWELPNMSHYIPNTGDSDNIIEFDYDEDSAAEPQVSGGGSAEYRVGASSGRRPKRKSTGEGEIDAQVHKGSYASESEAYIRQMRRKLIMMDMKVKEKELAASAARRAAAEEEAEASKERLAAAELVAEMQNARLAAAYAGVEAQKARLAAAKAEGEALKACHALKLIAAKADVEAQKIRLATVKEALQHQQMLLEMKRKLLMSFFVVLAEDWCAAVPCSWVDEEGGVYRWPKKEKVQVAVIRGLEPDSSWNEAPFVRALGPYGTLKEAREVEIRMAELCVKDERHMTVSRRGRRRIKKRNFDDYVLEQDNDSDVIDEVILPLLEHEVSQLAPENVTFGTKRSKTKVASETHLKSTSVNSRESVPEKSQIEDSQSMSQKTSRSTNHRADTEVPVAKSTPAPSQVEAVHDETDLSIAAMIKGEFKKLHARFDRIEKRQDALQKKVDILLGNMPSGGLGNFTISASSEADLPNFPLKSIKELKNFDEDLRNSEDLRMQLKLKIKIIGGLSGESHMRRALGTMLTNDLAYRLTWMSPQHFSKKGGCAKDSLLFSALALCDVLIASILEFHPNGSKAVLERVGKQWLQHAGDRIKYAENKSRKES